MKNTGTSKLTTPTDREIAMMRVFDAPRHLTHALVLGVPDLAFCIVGPVVTWNRGPAFGPHWYPLALVVLAMPQAWAGGGLRVMQLRARADA